MLALAGEASSSDPPRAIAVAIAVRIMRILIVFTSPDGAGRARVRVHGTHWQGTSCTGRQQAVQYPACASSAQAAMSSSVMTRPDLVRSG